MWKVYSEAYCQRWEKIFKKIDKYNKQLKSENKVILWDWKIVPSMYYLVEENTNAILLQNKSLSSLVDEIYIKTSGAIVL